MDSLARLRSSILTLVIAACAGALPWTPAAAGQDVELEHHAAASASGAQQDPTRRIVLLSTAGQSGTVGARTATGTPSVSLGDGYWGLGGTSLVRVATLGTLGLLALLIAGISFGQRLQRRPLRALRLAALLAGMHLSLSEAKAAPASVNYQGRVIVDGEAPSGTGYFKFALVDESNQVLWSNDGKTPEPSDFISLQLVDGHFFCDLGKSMFTLPVTALAGRELRLRVWFAETQAEASGGTFHQLEPDLAFSSVPYAFEALVSEEARTLEGQSAADFAPASHQHGAGDISSGTLAAARLPALTDALIPDSVSLSSLTQIANRSHDSLTDVGTKSHAAIDSHIDATSNVHGLTFTAEGAGGGLDSDLLDGQSSGAFGLLGGRPGGQTLSGGASAFESLTLDSTANATKGFVLINPTGGNVGIGTTNPETNLHVAGKALFATEGTNGLRITPAADADTGILNVTNAANTVNLLTVDGNGRVLMNGSGNVGVGTAAPGQKFVVSSSTNPVVRIEPGGSNTADPSLWLYDPFSNGNQAGFKLVYGNQSGSTTFDNLYDDASGDILFRTRAAGTPVNVMTLKGSGNVGIGTTGPLWKLDVSGPIHTNDQLFVDGNISAAGRFTSSRGPIQLSVNCQTASCNDGFSFLKSTGYAVQPPTAIGSTSPLSGDIFLPSDFWVSRSMEVDGRLYAPIIESSRQGGGLGDRDLMIGSDATVAFFVDTDLSDTGNPGTDKFEWWAHSNFLFPAGVVPDPKKKVAELLANGNLRIAGSLSQNVSLDLAESFLTSEPVEAGDVVRADLDRKGAIRLTSGPNDTAVLGVISAKPGVVLGGAPFDVDSLGETWGEEVKVMFLAEEVELSEQVLQRNASLRSRMEKLNRAAVAQPNAPGSGPRDAQPNEKPSADSEQEKLDVEHLVRSEAITIFCERNFAPVALAGRVPVKVDTQFGDIRAGDSLAPSPIAGVAMKATAAGPVIGTALEGFSGGRGQVLTFIQRETYTPPDPPRGHTEAHSISESVEAGDVLVVDRNELGKLRKGDTAADAGVVGIATAQSGVVSNGRPPLDSGEGDEGVLLAARLDDKGDEAARLRKALQSDIRPVSAVVALSGIVLCKVDASYGAIQIGDLLTTSPTNGHVMRSPDAAPGTIIGKALEPLDRGTGLIHVLVLQR